MAVGSLDTNILIKGWHQLSLSTKAKERTRKRKETHFLLER